MRHMPHGAGLPLVRPGQRVALPNRGGQVLATAQDAE